MSSSAGSIDSMRKRMQLLKIRQLIGPIIWILTPTDTNYSKLSFITEYAKKKTNNGQCQLNRPNIILKIYNADLLRRIETNHTLLSKFTINIATCSLVA